MANALRNVDPQAITLCKKGANGKTFFMVKMDEGAHVESLGSPKLIKADDEWKSVYCVVAEPGAEEQRGMIVKDGVLVPDPDSEPDVWLEEEEIREAAHRFVKNGGTITKGHDEVMNEAFKPYGDLVESAVAPVDMDVNGQVIKSGSWFVGIELSDEGRRAVESGEFTGVSLSGPGERVPIAKASDDVREAVLKADGVWGTIKNALGFTNDSTASGTAATMTVNGTAIGSQSGTVESTEHSQEETDVADDKRIEALETNVGTLAKSVEALTERLGKVLDAAEQKKAPTVEDLAKSLDEAMESIAKIGEGVDALAEGRSSQGSTDTNGSKDLSEDEKYARSLLGVE